MLIAYGGKAKDYGQHKEEVNRIKEEHEKKFTQLCNVQNIDALKETLNSEDFKGFYGDMTVDQALLMKNENGEKLIYELLKEQ